MAQDWVDANDLTGMSRSGNVLETLGYDPDEVRANPSLRQEVMSKLAGPYQVAQATPPPPIGNPNPRSQNGNDLTQPPGQPRLLNRQQPTAPAQPVPESLSQAMPATSASVSPSGTTAAPGNVDVENARKAAGSLLAPQPTAPDTSAQDNMISSQSVPLNPRDPLYKEGLFGRIGRGLEGAAVGFAKGGVPGAVGGAADPATVGVKPYGAPNSGYDIDDQARQAKLALAQKQRTDATQKFKEQVDARRAADLGAKDAGTISTTLTELPNKTMQAQADQTRANAEAARVQQTSPEGTVAATDAEFKEASKKADSLGLKGQNRTLYLANGKIPDPRQPDGDEIATSQALLAYRRETGHDPQTLEDYRQVRQAAKGEKDAGTNMLIPDGKGGMTSKLVQPGDSVPQGATTMSGKPAVVKADGTAPTVADRNRASLAHVANDNLDQIEDVINRRPELLGAIQGRISNISQMIGSDDPDLQVLGNAAHNFAMANAGIHGSRSFENVRAAEQELLNNLKSGTKGVGGAIRSNRQNLQSIIERVEGKKGGDTSTSGAKGGFSWDDQPVKK